MIISTAGGPPLILDGFQNVVVSLINEFSFRFGCFVFDVKQLLKVKFVVYHAMTKIGAYE